MPKVSAKTKKASKGFRNNLISSSQYVGPYYVKDFKYISPAALVVKKNVKKLERSERCGFVKLWSQEVLKGFKQFLYQGSLHGVK